LVACLFPLAGNDQPIANHELALSSVANNTITPATVVTDALGRASVVVSSANGDDTINVTALDGSVVGSHSFNVAEDILSFAAGVADAEYAVGSINDIVVTWESENAPVAGQQLRFALTAGQLLSPAVAPSYYHC